MINTSWTSPTGAGPSGSGRSGAWPAIWLVVLVLAAACHRKSADHANAAAPPPPAPAQSTIGRKSVDDAGRVLQTYFALIGAHRYAEAFALREPAAGVDLDDFAASLETFADYRAQVGAPGPVQGAAGSLYISFPVVISGRLKTGASVHKSGSITLRRVNDVTGATVAQRRWRIVSADLR